jgi:hypothetical protein
MESAFLSPGQGDVEGRAGRSLYESDFYRWIQHTSTALKAKDFDQVDWDNLIEEIESMGRGERKELKSRLIVLIEHLLKLLYWDAEKAWSGLGWRSTVIEQRRQIQLTLEDSPSLRSALLEMCPDAYQQAREDVLLKSQLSEAAIPSEPPYAFSDLLNPRYLPGQSQPED